jgi:peptidoglycan/LPS O-acetylase OafA/YrhL
MKMAGDASYAMYLTGPVVIAIISPDNMTLKILTIIVIITASILINRLLENKLLNIIRKGVRRVIDRRKSVDKKPFKL